MNSLLSQSVFEDPYGTLLGDGRWQITVAAILTIGLYSLLYRENKFYRLVEHIFVGLATGWSIYIIWNDVFYPQWWVPMVGKVGPDGNVMANSNWLWAAVAPVGIVGFFVFSPKYAWLSRIPLGTIVGLWAGQQFLAFQNRFIPQIANQAQPIIPNEWTLMQPGLPPGTVTISDAINNFIVVITWLLVLSYFLYSFEQKNKTIQKSAQLGRWLLMVGFGAIFGTTMMTRFVLFIDRATFLLTEWLRLGPTT